MIELRPFKAEDALQIISASAKQPKLDIGDPFYRKLAKRYETDGPAATGFDGDRILGCGGLVMLAEGLADGWCLFTPGIDEFPGAVARLVKHQLERWFKDFRLRRVGVWMRTDFPVGIRFAKFLGFKNEGIAEKYHPDGSDAILMGYTKE